MSFYHIQYKSPKPEEYIALRVEAGLSKKSLKAAEIGLPNSWFVVSLYVEEQLIGMGRIVGDGGTVFQIVDIAVKPTYQGRGLGKVIMKELIHYLEEHTVEGAYVSLIADEPADKLYEQFGFAYTYPKAHGMFRRF